jgi:acetoin utilization deacetylase AcuC-like enzyme
MVLTLIQRSVSEAQGAGGLRVLDLLGDTSVGEGSLDSVYASVGLVKDGVVAVLTGTFKYAYCATRPPGGWYVGRKD